MLIDIYKQSYFNRQFELKVAEAHKKGLIKAPIYLSIGTEHIPATIASLGKKYAIFPQHRCHSWLLSFGVDPTLIAKEILGHKDGLNGGYGGSASMSATELYFIAPHDGHLGSNAPIGVGYAHATGKPVIIHLGDAAVEEDYVLACLGYAKTHKLDVTFIVEDNGFSILTPTKNRRSWNIVDVAKGFNITSETLREDYSQCTRLKERLEDKWLYDPILLNIKCKRHYWHCGSGTDEVPPEKDNLWYLRNWLKGTGGVNGWNWDKIHKDIEDQVKEIWNPLIGEK